jgi:hypothetical protein
VAVRGETAYTVVWSGRGVGDTTGVFAATRLRIPVPLVAEGSPLGEVFSTLQGVDVESIVTEASDRWIAAGLNQAELTILSLINVHVVDFSDGTLGGNIGNDVFLDLDAAGHGWFIDATLADDAEFQIVAAATERIARESSEAFGQMDLLTVVMHELGHALGKPHLEAPDLMGEALTTGTRRLPGGESAALNAQQVDALFAQSRFATSDTNERDDGEEKLFIPLAPVAAPIIESRDEAESNASAYPVVEIDDDKEPDGEDSELDSNRWDLKLPPFG